MLNDSDHLKSGVQSTAETSYCSNIPKTVDSVEYNIRNGKH